MYLRRRVVPARRHPSCMTVESDCQQCIFCGGADLTDEHLIADWVQRAFARSRRPGPSLSGTFVARDQMRMHREPPIDSVKVLCRRCNNEWVSQLDNAASIILKPLIRGERAVKLDRAGQTVFAAWLFKTALVFDAMDNGGSGRLAVQREAFYRSRQAPVGLLIFAGPALDVPFTVPGIPEVAGLRLFGLRPLDGALNLTVNEKHADGRITPGAPVAIPIPGYQVMLGGLFVYMCSRFPFFDLTPDFAQIWPVAADEVEVQVKPPGSANGATG